jgi:hypothetical protein
MERTGITGPEPLFSIFGRRRSWELLSGGGGIGSGTGFKLDSWFCVSRATGSVIPYF